MNNLVVCGDSFSFGDNETDWTKIVANKLNLNLINLSIIGCSNLAICYQIDYAIKNLSFDLMVINLTTAERFEIDEDDLNYPASIEDFRTNVDECESNKFGKTPSITSGNVILHLRNSRLDMIKNKLQNLSLRLSAQSQSWALQHLLKGLGNKFLLYRNIFPVFYHDLKKYENEYYFELDDILINSGAHDFEENKSKEQKNSNHLSISENKNFAKRVLKDFNETKLCF